MMTKRERLFKPAIRLAACTALGAVMQASLAAAPAHISPPGAQADARASKADGGAPRLAWVLGNSGYQGMTALKNPAHDAQDMCASLQRLGFETLCHTDVRDRATLLKQFNEFAERLTPATQGLIYYAGHAVQINGRNYLVPTQASVRSLADVPQQLVDLQILMDALRKQGNTFNVVILDACRQDPFSDTPDPHLGASADHGNLLRGLGPRLASSKGPMSYGLAPIQDAPEGAIVFYATGANDVALDGSGRNGLLTKHLLQHIETPGIPVEDMIKRVSAGVQSESRHLARKAQTPYVYSSFTGEFCFASCSLASSDRQPVPVAPSAAPATSLSLPAAAPQVAPRAQPTMPALF